MKLSQMTTEQLQAKRARIDEILAKRQTDFIELFKSNHDKLVKLHKKAGGKTFKGTFQELLAEVGYDPDQCVDDDLSTVGTRAYVRDSDYERATSVFGDTAHHDLSEGWYTSNRDVPCWVREWMTVLIKKPVSQVNSRLLTEAEARALLRVLGKEVTE